MEQTLIDHIDIYTNEGWIKNGALLIEGKRIKEFLSSSAKLTAVHGDVRIINGKGLRAIPGFIDTHIHGANGADVMDDSADALRTIARALPREGTTRILATTITAEQRTLESVLTTIATYGQRAGEARIEGIHLEGPFIAKERVGAQPEHAIIPPDARLLTDWQRRAKGKIKTITLAPGLDVDGTCIKQAIALGMNVSAGHTNATYEMMKEAVARGVNQVTHLCNAMPGMHHRDIGVVGSTAMLSELRAELIVDGIHVTDEMIALLVRLIGVDRLMLITDGMRAKYMKPGMYDLGGQAVRVTEDFRATLSDGTLAGSIVRMNDAACRMSQIPGVEWEDVVRMTSLHPARQLGIDGETGSISIGKDADIVLVDEAFRVYLTMCQGAIGYDQLHTT